MADPSLARYAGRFVWLELNLDSPKNGAFFKQHAVPGTPTFFVIDPAGEEVAATQVGAMSAPEVIKFLERGARDITTKTLAPPDAAMARGDSLLAGRHPADAARAYEEALRLAPPTWSRRQLAVASLIRALQTAGDWQTCAESAAAEAPHLERDAMFGRTLVAGMWCVNQGEPAPWADRAAKTIEPLAEEALGLDVTVRDHRFELYRNLMFLSLAHDDRTGAAKWGDLWLREIDAIEPASDDERTALDIARVEDVSVYGDPARILPELAASEKAMPGNYNASLRFAQMEIAAQQYDDAIAACDRGLGHVTGPLGRSWLLQTKAKALMGKKEPAAARRTLEDSMRSARKIAVESTRENNLRRIRKAIEETGY